MNKYKTMNLNILTLIERTIVLKYHLPHLSKGINKSDITHSSLTDDCYEVTDLPNFSQIIYESILYYSYSDFSRQGGNLQGMFSNAFGKKFKYDENANTLAKLKFGIYGEALFYAILRSFYGNDVLVSRGIFYDMQKKSEVTGYDSFHFLEIGNELQLWFGETKFHQTYNGAISSVFDNIEKALSYDYLETNLYTIIQHRGDITDDSKHRITKILDRWQKSIITDLQQELIDNNIKLVYPVLLTYDIIRNDFDNSIHKAIEFINKKASQIKLNKTSLDFSIFFILIPILDSKRCKETIIQWIDNNEPLKLLDV